jgi:hypothetical protein
MIRAHPKHLSATKSRRQACAILFLLAACGDNLTPLPHGGYNAPEQTALPCLPNLDGQIDAAEAQHVLGVPANFLISPAGATRQVDLEGTVDDTGVRVFDWGTDLADDQHASFTATAASGKWYASSFPSNAFVVPYDAGDALEAVYQQDASNLWLLGLASAQQNPPQGKTLLVYSTPIAVLRFPLQVGSSWTSMSVVQNATVLGLPYAGKDTYQVRDDASGHLILPDLTLTQAHRVRTTLTTEPAIGPMLVRRQVSFIFECFGEVARAASRDNETNDDFTTAAEVRRLSLGR